MSISRQMFAILAANLFRHSVAQRFTFRPKAPHPQAQGRPFRGAYLIVSAPDDAKPSYTTG